MKKFNKIIEYTRIKELKTQKRYHQWKKERMEEIRGMKDAELIDYIKYYEHKKSNPKYRQEDASAVLSAPITIMTVFLCIYFNFIPTDMNIFTNVYIDYMICLAVTSVILISIGFAIIIGYVMLSNYIKAMQVEYFEEQWKLLKEEKKFRKQEVKKSVKKNKKSKNKKE